MAGYVLHHYNIIDRSRIEELGPRSLPIIEKYGGELIVASPMKTLAGSTSYTNMVMYRFESFEAAVTFYNSEEMIELRKFSSQVIEGFATVVSGHSETESVVKSGYFTR
ncbi:MULTISPECIES: DUF1330 domain-containing protein [unclassified Pseudovibrio]|uniref:DUF1330 domain-containing protein n=1 Tax=unclassified Pseudovibrio TaxID=2627060 RepID=UPI0007AE4BD2|nr:MULTISPECIES: DUF1330 domain-containing protein [unclassified Pseudovibrio]KZK98852.1 hypothetical protein PsW74_03441 [Pseudovibrio sp. W74]KZL09345.1 hypothetical protein PsAD14_02406 [Pseudovibrio sp. Ad14]